MRIKHCIAVWVLIAAMSFAGCGKKTAQAPVATSQEPLATSGQAHAKSTPEQPPLPEWAPQNPSPEFLRAAKVLKPLPFEYPMTSNVGPGLTEAYKQKLRRLVYPAAYEFFGSLTDQQMKSFLTKKEIRLRARELSPAQRRALDNWFESFRKAAESGPSEYQDIRVILYKLGAREDLSNIRFGFGMNKSHSVGVYFWLREAQGDPKAAMTSDFAQL